MPASRGIATRWSSPSGRAASRGRPPEGCERGGVGAGGQRRAAPGRARRDAPMPERFAPPAPAATMAPTSRRSESDMSDTPTPSDRATADKPKATQRDAVEKLLATAPFRSTGATTLGGRRLDYRVEAAFVPVLSAELGEQRGEPQAAVF